MARHVGAPVVAVSGQEHDPRDRRLPAVVVAVEDVDRVRPPDAIASQVG
jgi:hypothetical protein